MDFNSLTPDERAILGSIAFPGLPQPAGLGIDRENICRGLAQKGFLDKMETSPGLISYRMQIGVHVGFCQWCEEVFSEAAQA